MSAVKKIHIYWKVTKDYGLQYKKEGDFELSVYSDVGWVGNVDDRKSTSGGSFFLGEILVTWISKKQSCISQIAIEAKYIAYLVNCSNIVWIKQLLEDMQEKFIEPVTIYCENTSVINISNNPVIHAKTKHISIKYH